MRDFYEPASPSPPKLGPQIDGTFIKYSPADSIRLGKIRPKTDITWVIDSWDTWEGRAASGLQGAYLKTDFLDKNGYLQAAQASGFQDGLQRTYSNFLINMDNNYIQVKIETHFKGTVRFL